MAHPQKVSYTSSSHDAEQDLVIGDFRAHIRNTVNKSDIALEIGPSYMPILPKREGYNVKVVDHAEQKALIEKYRALDVDTSRIEQVDYVWAGEKLSTLISGERFKYVVASHVIEHTTDLAGFLICCTSLLQSDGEIILIVPDKRYCFDAIQPITDCAKVLSDFIEGSPRHSLESLYREESQVLARYGDADMLAWWQGDVADFKFMRTDPVSRFNAVKTAFQQSTYYIDAHEYFFTPASFEMIIEELRFLKVLPLSISLLTRSRGCEFLVTLKPSETDTHNTDANQFLAMKKQLVLRLIREQMEGFLKIKSL